MLGSLCITIRRKGGSGGGNLYLPMATGCDRLAAEEGGGGAFLAARVSPSELHLLMLAAESASALALPDNRRTRCGLLGARAARRMSLWLSDTERIRLKPGRPKLFRRWPTRIS